jgi:hypothetical protein
MTKCYQKCREHTVGGADLGVCVVLLRRNESSPHQFDEINLRTLILQYGATSGACSRLPE